jgi:L-amino acid N-acyltransferase YncA
MTVGLRDAVESDLKAISALYAREVLEGTATFELEPPSQIEMGRRFATVKGYGLPWIVAEVDGQFAGYAYLGPFRTRAAYRYAVENSIYVAPGMQGRGVGRALLNALIGEARALGLRHVMGVISQSDTSDASLALHRALGFADAGVWRHAGWKFERWLDVWVMQLDLAPDANAPQGDGLDLSGS